MIQKFLAVVILSCPAYLLADGALAFSCNKDGSNCAVNFVSASGKATKLLDGYTRYETENKMSFKYYPNHLGAFTFSCGSPCNTWFFVNLETGEMSPVGFSLPMAVDPVHYLVAYPDYNKKQQVLKIANIFKPDDVIMIQRDFADVADLSISTSVEFLKNKPAIQFAYPTGANYNMKTEIIPLDYKMLGIESSS